MYVPMFYVVVLHLIITLTAGAVAKYCDKHIRLCLSVREHISGTIHATFSNFSVHVAYGCGSVLPLQGD